MNFITSERASIESLNSKLSQHAPSLKAKLSQALSLLDGYATTGSDALLKMAMTIHQDVVDAIGNRRPERIEEMPE